MIREHVVACALVIGISIGALVNGWRLDAGHQRDMGAAREEIANLKAAIASQTASAEIMAAEYAEAVRVAKTAQDAARSARQKIKPASVAADCDGAVDLLWESLR